MRGPTTALERLRESLRHEKGKKPATPLQVRLLALATLGEADAKNRRPVKVVGPFETRLKGVTIWAEPATVEGVRVDFLPFTRWLRPLDLKSVCKSLGNEPMGEAEMETTAKILSGEWE